VLYKGPPPPPSPRIIEAFRDALKNCMTLEIAATLVNIPRRTLLKWIEMGRRGAIEYAPFVDMIDEERAKLAGTLLSYLHTAAFTERNLDAVKFLYKHRLQKDEERFAERIYAIEDRVQEEVASGLDTGTAEEDLAAAEARLERH
jgi:hypothetical protein